ncbi:nucleotide exchange factor GrpE [Kangiella sp. TOML190]|uniref:nucleotide exchange factor GrpE n=1 Tax=Kangiella sp. TOML190 TaxID=2931351 RepID=UPI0020418CD8|nr:nucleotide exchange factor GrpE [Kangiella sp. TOML190]
MSEKDVKNQEAIKAAEEAVEQAEEIAAEIEGELVEELTGDAARIDELEKALEEAEAKAADNMDLALRTKAEAENIRRRSENEVASARKFAIEKFANEMLAVVDSLEQGLAQKAEHEESIAMKEGMELTLKMTLATLEKFGIEQLNPLEEIFDPQLHEAMTMVPSPDHESNTVIDVFQKGYSLNGRLIRPARVVVAQ